MNMRDADKLKSGAVVRESFRPDSSGHPIHGIVIGKKHVKERHAARVLGGFKEERYDIVIHWTCKETVIPHIEYEMRAPRLQVRQNWDLMVVSHAE